LVRRGGRSSPQIRVVFLIVSVIFITMLLRSYCTSTLLLQAAISHFIPTARHNFGTQPNLTVVHAD
jgi:hypothetical protein